MAYFLPAPFDPKMEVELQELIEQALGRPVRTWNPLEGIRVSPERVDVEELEASATGHPVGPVSLLCPLDR